MSIASTRLPMHTSSFDRCSIIRNTQFRSPRVWERITKLDHIVILVRAIDVSLAWYSTLLKLLGFEKTRAHVWISADGLAIDLKEAAPRTPVYERPAPGLNHLGFTAPTLVDFARVRYGMEATGLPVPEEQHFSSERETFFIDSDGMRVEGDGVWIARRSKPRRSAWPWHVSQSHQTGLHGLSLAPWSRHYATRV